MIKTEQQQDNDTPNFSWKTEIEKAVKETKKRIIILEQTGNVECAIRTKRRLKQAEKKLAESFTVG